MLVKIGLKSFTQVGQARLHAAVKYIVSELDPHAADEVGVLGKFNRHIVAPKALQAIAHVFLLRLAKRNGALHAGGAVGLIQFHQPLQMLQDVKESTRFLFDQQLHGFSRSVGIQPTLDLAAFEQLLGQAAGLFAAFHWVDLSGQFPVGLVDQALLIF